MNKYIRSKTSFINYSGNYKTGNFIWSGIKSTAANIGGKAMSGLGHLSNIGSAVMVPTMIASMAIPNADLRAEEKMRKIDLEREKKGLPAIGSYGRKLAATQNGVMTANPNPNLVQPPAIPPNSLRGA